jgi:hypothetical protein
MADQTIDGREATVVLVAQDPIGLAPYSKFTAVQDPRRLSVPTVRVESVPESICPSNDRTHSVSTTQADVTEKLLTTPHTSEIDLERHATGHHEGIYWKSPLMMAAFFLVGVIASISHHFYYSSLNGKQVGNDNAQQWALR